MRNLKSAADMSKYSDEHQRMINEVRELLEFTLDPKRTPVAMAGQSDITSERLWEIALERRRQRIS